MWRRTVDGVMSPGEREDAKRVALVPVSGDGAASEQWDGGQVDEDVAPAQSSSGWLYLMNDGPRYLYAAAAYSLDGIIPDPNFWSASMCLNFTDEPDATDHEWAAPECDPIPNEGYFCGKDDQAPVEANAAVLRFNPMAQSGDCHLSLPAVGVKGVAGPATSLVWEWRVDLSLSEMDKVAPPDCFRFSTGVGGEVCQQGTGCPTGIWSKGTLTWPADLWGPDWRIRCRTARCA